MLKPDFTFCHTVIVRPWQKRGISADVYDEPREYRCRLNFSTRVSNGGGSSPTAHRAAAGTGFFSAGTRFPTGSKLQFDGREYTITEVRACYGFGGEETHVEAAFV